MDRIQAFIPEVRSAYEESRRRMGAFPEALRGQGYAYLHKANPTGTEEGGKNRICYLLPYWLREQCGLDEETCREMAVGNIFLMLYFFIQDDIMDTADPNACRALPLANLCHGEFHRAYSRLFPGDSPFWDHYRAYIAEWALSVATEAEADFFAADPLRLAGKSAPLKLCSTAALLLADQEENIPRVSRLVEGALVALQMADDWADWASDLAEGSYNSLLSHYRSAAGWPSDSPVQEERVRDFLYIDEGLGTYSAAAERLYEPEAYRGLRLSHLQAFHESLLANLREGAAEIAAAKRQLERGGLHYWLSQASQTKPD
ncbi:hypothetical protein [Gorillibacterium sp. sgz500922]|uniref:hypothetical protein n=1 Tax=Gorillibacterium sp. sgz500922 TaxID=3446694 RepID=UPI003F660E3D